MEEPIGKFCETVAKFCNHLDASCSALRESVDRRPIPLDSASKTFLHSVNSRISAAGDDLNMLESMSFATVSFEELLGHCNEVLKKNQSDICALQDHLRSSSNYIPPLDFDEDDVLEDSVFDNFSPGSSNRSMGNDVVGDDTLFDDTMSLKNFGISDVCLASIASRDTKFEMDEPDFLIEDETTDALDQHEDSRILLSISKEDYESLPKHMKGLVPWEDLLVAVEKINSCIEANKIKSNTFRQDEIELLGLGHKARSYLLLLIKMNRLSIETDGGVISYKVL